MTIWQGHFIRNFVKNGDLKNLINGVNINQ